MPEYQILPKGIKKIMHRELSEKFDSIARLSGYDRDLIWTVKHDILDQLESLESYDQLESFCSKYYRMSLSEWVNSL